MRVRNSIIVLLTFAFFVLSTEKIQAQFQDIKFEYLNIDNGLSQNRVQCLIRDKKGYLWIGTQKGLNKFDGQKITIYKNISDQANSLSGNNIECIYEDRSENLWIGTATGLNLYERKTETFKRFVSISNTANPNSFENDNRIFSVLEDKTGNIWCATQNGLTKWNLSDGSYKKYNIPVQENYYNTNVISSFLLDDQGYFWLGTEDDKIWRFNPKNTQFENFPIPLLKGISGMFKVILQDKSGTIWIGTYGKGLFSFDSNSKKFQHFDSDGNHTGTHGKLIKDLFLDNNRYLYISVDFGGINRLDLQTMTFDYCIRTENEDGNLKSDAVMTVYVDGEGILYAGTSVAGLNIHNPKKDRFTNYRHNGNSENSLIYNVVFKFFEDSKGLIWIGTDGGGVSVFNPVKKTFTNYQHNSANPNSISGNAVLSITEDKNNDIWLGTWGAGLNRFDRKTGKFFHFMPDASNPFAISNPSVWDLYTDAQGKIWISNDYSGIDVFDIKKGVIRKYRNNAKDSALLGPLMTNRFIQQCDRQLGLAANNGYFILDTMTNKLNPVRKFDGYDLNDVYLDKNGTFWAGTSNSGVILSHADGSSEKFDESNGFLSNSVSGFLEDSDGTMWILTSSGLAEYNSQNKKFRYFTEYDGLQGKQFSTHARLKAKDGTFYIGGYNGFSVFHPEDIKVSKYLPAVYIDEFRIFNEPVSIGTPSSPLKQSVSETKEIVLSYKQSVFSFGFTAVNFTYPENAVYAYKMEGYDLKWNYTDASRRYVSYTNLDPGEYTFQVKATNNDGVWNETPTNLMIVITPPIWKTWWFKIFAALLVTGSIISFYRFRINQLKHQRRILEQKVNERTAELQEANITLEENQEEILMQNESILKQRDILELKNKELEDKNEEIIQITNLLHESDQTKIKFFTNISHDLRTPLTLILGYLESIVPAIVSNKTISDRISIVTNNANRLLRLVNQLLDFQKIDAESLKLQPEFLDIISFCQGIFDSFRLQAETRNIDYRLKSVREFQNTWFDPDKLDKILFNLLSNAFKFTPDGGSIVFEIDFPESSQSEGKEIDKVRFKVVDSGIGMQKADLLKIFDRFYQAEHPHSQKHEGSGIGLALTKHLVEIHKGSISVESKPEQGACFQVVLSVGNSIAVSTVLTGDSSNTGYVKNNVSGTQERHTDITQSIVEGSTILIVEDNDELRHFIFEELAFKYRVIEATNGKQGLELATLEQPDLVISDVMMPFMNGFEMCEKLKLEWQTSHIPIVILTAKADDESLYQSLEIGADAYIKKPFHLKHLLFQVENLLTTRRNLFEKFSKNSISDLEKHLANSVENNFLKKLHQIIENHIADNEFGVEDLASELNMSRSQLYKKTFSILSISAGELIRTVRLKNAAQLLRDDKNSVSDVAFMVGFADRPQFSRSFTNLFGISPKQFQIKENEVIPGPISDQED